MKKLLNGILAKILGGNAKKTHNKEYGNIPKPDDTRIQEAWPVPETPFMIIKLEELFFVSWKEYRLTNPTKSIIEAWEQANHPDWQLHINLITSIFIELNNIQNETEKMEKNAANENYLKNLKKRTTILNNK